MKINKLESYSYNYYYHKILKLINYARTEVLVSGRCYFVICNEDDFRNKFNSIFNIINVFRELDYNFLFPNIHTHTDIENKFKFVYKSSN